jgi:hypothetical protein
MVGMMILAWRFQKTTGACQGKNQRGIFSGAAPDRCDVGRSPRGKRPARHESGAENYTFPQTPQEIFGLESKNFKFP